MPKRTKLADLLEKDRERFMSVLEAAPSPEKAAAFLESETDRLLIRYNEADITENEREAAAGMLRTVRMAMPLVDSVGETKIWENTDGTGDASLQKKRKSFLCIAAGILAFALIIKLTVAPNTGEGASFLSWVKLAAAALEGVFLFLGGINLRGKDNSGTNKRRQKTESLVDSSRVFRQYRSIMMVVDDNIESRADTDGWTKSVSPVGAGMLTEAETELYSDLLEALYSKDGAYALDKLLGIRYYLHKRGVELLDYSDDTAAAFDIMPSKKAGTLRPALVCGGTVLRRGMAAKEVL